MDSKDWGSLVCARIPGEHGDIGPEDAPSIWTSYWLAEEQGSIAT